MKKSMLAVLLLVLIIGALAFYNTAQIMTRAQPVNIGTKGKQLVIIDAGHGGVDGGAVSGDVVEKDINLNIALKLRELAKASGFEIIMIREEDISIHNEDATSTRKKKETDLKNRLKIMNSHPEAVYISIHQNSFTQSKYYGTQILYAPDVEESQLLGNAIQSSVKALLQNENEREIRKCTEDVYIIYNARIPAVLVECGFLSNPQEKSMLVTDEYQNQMAFAVLCGIIDYCAYNHRI
ncbi:MAG TPA: N-acetylmuramoyl-L-alanine amidase [Ruminococcaceae bacterium]|nr:N-acetylmuramoyl-L-alanine amidase [Oscillospiraceae bacterium]